MNGMQTTSTARVKRKAHRELRTHVGREHLRRGSRRAAIAVTAGLVLTACSSGSGDEGDLDLAAVEEDLVAASNEEALAAVTVELPDYQALAWVTRPERAGIVPTEEYALDLDPAECQSIHHAIRLRTADDREAFEDDLVFEYGTLLHSSWMDDDEANDVAAAPPVTVAVREFAASDVPQQVAQAALDGAAGCDEYRHGPDEDGVTLVVSEIAATSTSVDGVEGDMVLVTDTWSYDGLSEDEAFEPQPESTYLYPHERLVIKVLLGDGPDDGLAAEVISQVLAQVDA
ncbi:hypothetical protein [Demequina sp. NBRC 110056]|uniref:hypothetical protein n=1 Tax=Demequina sp. NBRC 110056 TaxID=1570345 RepID=UPI000A0274BC|nr:hypothetical protein [Demequina sp. NBRC 110056]